MSWKPQHAICLCFAFFLALFLHSQAHADTYQIFQFTDYNGAGPVLYIDNQADVVFRGPCADTTFNCFSLFQPFGSSIVTTNQLPPLNYTGSDISDPGASQPLNLNISGYQASYDPTARTLIGGPVGDPQLFNNVVIDFMVMDEFGDIAWTNGDLEFNYLAYDITAHQTPEPADLALLLTGLIPLAAIVRRRFLPAS